MMNTFRNHKILILGLIALSLISFATIFYLDHTTYAQTTLNLTDLEQSKENLEVKFKMIRLLTDQFFAVIKVI